MSPVKGLTDTIVPSLPRIGQLKKGAKAEGNIGREIEWFRFVGDSEIAAAFAEAYGKEPKFIPSVYLPYRSPDEVFSVWKEKWGKSGLIHRCDGEMTTVVRKGNAYSRIPEKCPYAGRVYKSDAEKKADPPCDLKGRLTVILPELWQRGYVGYVTVNTGSVNDVIQIMSLLKVVYDGRQDLRGIEFQLRRVQAKISSPKPDSDERVRMPHWMVQLEVAPEWARLQLQMAQHAAKMIEAPAPKLIESTGEIVEDIDDADWGVIDGVADEMDNDAPKPKSAAKPVWTQAQKDEFTALVNDNGIKVADLNVAFGGERIGDVEFEAAKQVVLDLVATRKLNAEEAPF